MIKLHDFSTGYDGVPVLQHISLQIPKGTITTLVGPNGCGKTTLLRAIAGQLKPLGGQITIQEQDIACFDRKALARTVALLPQMRDVPSLTVEALVQHGRYPHLGLSRRLTDRDKEAVGDAMRKADITALAHRELKELSGGERQRAYITMALAQDTDIILLDEPTTHLDLNRQFELLALIEALKAAGKTVVMVLHDLDHALRCSDQVVLLQEGHLMQVGTPQALLSSGALEQVFDITVKHTPDGCLFFPNQR